MADNRVLPAKACAILTLMSNGYGVRGCAIELGMSESAIKFHLKHIYPVLRANGIVQAVATALRRGLIV